MTISAACIAEKFSEVYGRYCPHRRGSVSCQKVIVENEQIIPQKNSRYASNPCGIEVIQEQSLTKILLGKFPRRIFVNNRLIIIYITRQGRRCTRGACLQEAASSKAARSRSLVFIGLSQ